MSAAEQSILIVDDEFSLVETLDEILSWQGYVVHTAPNGRVALQAIERAAPDLVLLDSMMPVMDGLAMLEALRQRPEHARLPVILMSVASVTAEGDAPLFDALLRKPFESKALIELVRTLLAR